MIQYQHKQYGRGFSISAAYALTLSKLMVDVCKNKLVVLYERQRELRGKELIWDITPLEIAVTRAHLWSWRKVWGRSLKANGPLKNKIKN